VLPVWIHKGPGAVFGCYAVPETVSFSGCIEGPQRRLPSRQAFRDAGGGRFGGQIVVEKAKKSVAKDIKDKDSGFRKGDFVVYPTHGVGKILGVETQEVSGHSLQLIIIHFEKDRMTLRVPVAKAKNSGLRKLSSRKVMDAALQTLKGRSRVKRAMWSRRAQEYEAKINSGDPVSIAEVVRDLHRNADQPDQSYSERQIYQAALDRLVRELAAIDGIDEQSAHQRLHQVLKAVAA
jgi:CarD family transcriptional regulator